MHPKKRGDHFTINGDQETVYTVDTFTTCQCTIFDFVKE